VSGRIKAAVLASGRGSNLQALIDAARDPDYPAEIALVICNVAAAGALTRAAEAGIATTVIDHRDFADRASFDTAMDAELVKNDIEIVCLAGFMRILSTAFVEAWTGRLLNIHPSLLPAFKGLNTHERALEAGAKLAGCTAHLVTPELDDGPILVQAAVPILPNDTPGDLAARVLEQEHVCYPLALRLIAENRVRIENGRVLVDAPSTETTALINPAPF